MGKTTEERDFTISKKKITVIAECIVITSAQELYFFFFPLLVGKESIFISLVGDAVDPNIVDGCNCKI